MVKTENKKLLYDSDQTDVDIEMDIEKTMEIYISHRKSFFLSKSSEKKIEEGFGSIIKQNEILIKQNELLRRQNEEIISWLEAIQLDIN